MHFDFELATKIAGLIVVCGTILGTMYYKVIKPIYYLIKSAQERSEKMDIIITHVLPNGGSSISDKLDRIEAMILINDQASKAIISVMSIGYWKTNSKGKCTEVGIGTCRLFGRTEAELLGSSWLEWVHPEDYHEVETRWQAAVNNGHDFNMEFRILRPDHTEITVTSIGYKVYNADKSQLVGYYGVLSQKNHNT